MTFRASARLKDRITRTDEEAAAETARRVGELVRAELEEPATART
jgi:hypothetical protein